MHKSAVFLFVLISYLFGAWSAVNWPLFVVSSSYDKFHNQKIYFTAQVVEDPETKNGSTYLVVLPEGSTQKIELRLFGVRNHIYAERILVIGKIKKPETFSNFNYPEYLHSRGIYAQIKYPEVYVLSQGKLNPLVYYSLIAKHWFFETVQKNIPGERGALLVSLLVGQKDLLSANTITAFSVTGTAHLIAVSGFLLTLIVINIFNFFLAWGRKPALIISLLVCMFYLVITGFAPGVSRAALMAYLYIFSRFMGRKYNMGLALGLTAVLLVTLNPLIIKYDLGFLLSFSSIAGIICFVPLFNILFTKVPQSFGFREILSTTLAAQLATIPITLYYFNQFSIVAPLANLLIIPVVILCSAWGFFSALPFIGPLVSYVISYPLAYTLYIVYGLASFKWASLNMVTRWYVIPLIYMAELLLYLLLRHILKKAEPFDRLSVL